MWVEEITIDGFKSFARRTTVPGMDPQFNAITGLNGSGKSNILDSICFVLGITNMQQVSSGQLQQTGGMLSRVVAVRRADLRQVAPGSVSMGRCWLRESTVPEP
jgi:recombinational DNA repair ATPase RecF